MNILLIDDEEELVSTLAERLEFRGFDADWVTNGDAALEAITKTFYDLAVIDVKMPGLSGFDLKKQLEAQCPEMKFIFLTGHGSEQDFKTGSLEAAFYLVKPIGIDRLTRKIQEALEL